MIMENDKRNDLLAWRLRAAEIERDYWQEIATKQESVIEAVRAWREGWHEGWMKTLTADGRREDSKTVKLIKAFDAYQDPTEVDRKA
jgi:hypothetical protein